MPRPTHYVHEIDVRCRLRVQIWDEQPGPRFAISIEYEWQDNDWRRVVCFDNWGGVVHRDRYRPDGSDLAHHERMLNSADGHQAIKWVLAHAKQEVGRYVKEFLRLGARRR